MLPASDRIVAYGRRSCARRDTALALGAADAGQLVHHVRDQDSLGANRPRLCDRARHDVGGDAVGGLEARLPTSAWTSVVRVDIGSSDLSSTVVLLVVVRL